MHVPAALATLGLCILLIVFVRLRWQHFSSLLQRLIVGCCATSIAVMAVAFLARISTTSDKVNFAVYWAAVLSYIFFLALFTRLRPRWLTTIVAVVMVLPLLSASAFLPLAAIFSNQPHVVRAIGDGLVSDLVPIDALTAGGSGVDFATYRRFSWMPFLQRRYVGTRYLNTQCNSAAAYAVLQPDRQSVLMACPPLAGSPPEEGRSIVLSLYSHH